MTMLGTWGPTSTMETVQALRVEQRHLELLLDITPLCDHGASQIGAPDCKRCARHQRCDQIDADIIRLLRRAS